MSNEDEEGRWRTRTRRALHLYVSNGEIWLFERRRSRSDCGRCGPGCVQFGEQVECLLSTCFIIVFHDRDEWALPFQLVQKKRYATRVRMRSHLHLTPGCNIQHLSMENFFSTLEITCIFKMLNVFIFSYVASNPKLFYLNCICQTVLVLDFIKLFYSSFINQDSLN